MRSGGSATSRFDTVLLDVEMRDPAAMAYFREQIADVAAVPVLDLREGSGAEPTPEPPAHAATLVRAPAGSRRRRKAPAGACACPGSGDRGDRRSQLQSPSPYRPRLSRSRRAAWSDAALGTARES